MSTAVRVLVVDDDSSVRELLNDLLTHCGYVVATAATGKAALELLQKHVFDTALLDVWLPDTDGLQLLRTIQQRDPGVTVVMMTGNPTLDTAIEALKLGAYDYLQKPLRTDVLRHCLSRTTEHRFLRREVNALRTRLGEDSGAKELVGVSPQIERVRELMRMVAASSSPVLIEGESGTGKELVAAGIHRLSPRRQRSLIPVNCSAIPADLVESELFGHVRGAFSGAVVANSGLFRAADGGTIFLDEVTELPTALQAKLLRVLQEGEIRAVGSTKTETVDVRVIAATNRVVDEAVKSGRLREDLFYRLNVVRIVVPPLRERRADIPILATHFLRQLNQRFGREVDGIAPEAMAALKAYDYPGNVRELEHLLERAYALGAKGRITLADLPPLTAETRTAPIAPGTLPTLAQVERDLILRALELHDHDRERAARAIGLSRRTMYRRLREYGLP